MLMTVLNAVYKRYKSVGIIALEKTAKLLLSGL